MSEDVEFPGDISTDNKEDRQGKFKIWYFDFSCLLLFDEHFVLNAIL